MQFIEPFLLWGALAVAIPIAIHFWHQKRGKPLPWAATQWLTERDQQQSRGLKLDNIPLLLIRCLLLIVLAVLLSQLILTGLTNQQAVQRVHLIQPHPLITENFRFELDEAVKKGEKVYWINQKGEPFDESSLVRESVDFNPLTLQTAINKLPAETTELHLYVVNDQMLTTAPMITVPARFRLHTTIDLTTEPRAFLALKAAKKLFVNRVGRLTAGAVADQTKLQATPAHSGSFRVLLDYRNPAEWQTVRAALTALSDVYGIAFMTDEKRMSSVAYDLIFTDRGPGNAGPNPSTLYVVSEIEQPMAESNVLFTNESLTPQTSERVATGQLPEWIAEQLVRHYGLNPVRYPVAQRILTSRFAPAMTRSTHPQPLVQNALLLLFVGLVLLERALALTKNA